jgi:hypothetical protein
MEYRCKTSKNQKLGQTDLGFARSNEILGCVGVGKIKFV